MKPTRKSSADPRTSGLPAFGSTPLKPAPQRSASRPAASILAFGAHPDDIEFGCGGIIANAARAGARIHFVICSRGEAGTHGTPRQRTAEAAAAAKLLGAECNFLPLEGDGRMEYRPANARKLAAAIRRLRPQIVLAPTLTGNQHPDHSCLARLVRDAARLARMGGIAELKKLPPHQIGQLLYFAVTSDGEPSGAAPLLIDISHPADLSAWRAAMAAHASQGLTRPYAELQLARARVFGLRAGVEYAQPLYANDPLVFSSLAALGGSARRY